MKTIKLKTIVIIMILLVLISNLTIAEITLSSKSKQLSRTPCYGPDCEEEIWRPPGYGETVCLGCPGCPGCGETGIDIDGSFTPVQSPSQVVILKPVTVPDKSREPCTGGTDCTKLQDPDAKKPISDIAGTNSEIKKQLKNSIKYAGNHLVSIINSSNPYKEASTKWFEYEEKVINKTEEAIEEFKRWMGVNIKGIEDLRELAWDEIYRTNSFYYPRYRKRNKLLADIDQIRSVDNDNDGIPNVEDDCESQAETENDFQDEDGCPDYVVSGAKLKRLTNEKSKQIMPNIHDDIVVWQQEVDENNTDIMWYNLSSNKEKQLTRDKGMQVVPSIHKGKVIWQDNRNNFVDVYMFNPNPPEISTGTVLDLDAWLESVYNSTNSVEAKLTKAMFTIENKIKNVVEVPGKERNLIGIKLSKSDFKDRPNCIILRENPKEESHTTLLRCSYSESIVEIKVLDNTSAAKELFKDLFLIKAMDEIKSEEIELSVENLEDQDNQEENSEESNNGDQEEQTQGTGAAIYNFITGNAVAENTGQEEEEEEEECRSVGTIILEDEEAECCAGLKRVTSDNYDACVNCGNNKCGEFEDNQNCPQDCKPTDKLKINLPSSRLSIKNTAYFSIENPSNKPYYLQTNNKGNLFNVYKFDKEWKQIDIPGAEACVLSEKDTYLVEIKPKHKLDLKWTLKECLTNGIIADVWHGSYKIEISYLDKDNNQKKVEKIIEIIKPRGIVEILRDFFVKKECTIDSDCKAVCVNFKDCVCENSKCIEKTIDCNKLQSNMNNMLKDANYCKRDADCFVKTNICPFTCHSFVNKKEVENLNQAFGYYGKSECAICRSSCAPPPKNIGCVENKCQIKDKDEEMLIKLNNTEFTNDYGQIGYITDKEITFLNCNVIVSILSELGNDKDLEFLGKLMDKKTTCLKEFSLIEDIMMFSPAQDKKIVKKLIDEDNATEWSGAIGQGSSFSFLLRDKNLYSINRVTLEKSSIKKFSIEISKDNVTFTKVFQGTAQDKDDIQEFNFEPVEARYVKLNIINSHEGSTANAAEFKVFGIGLALDLKMDKNFKTTEVIPFEIMFPENETLHVHEKWWEIYKKQDNKWYKLITRSAKQEDFVCDPYKPYIEMQDTYEKGEEIEFKFINPSNKTFKRYIYDDRSWFKIFRKDKEWKLVGDQCERINYRNCNNGFLPITKKLTRIQAPTLTEIQGSLSQATWHQQNCMTVVRKCGDSLYKDKKITYSQPGEYKVQFTYYEEGKENTSLIIEREFTIKGEECKQESDVFSEGDCCNELTKLTVREGVYKCVKEEEGDGDEDGGEDNGEEQQPCKKSGEEFSDGECCSGLTKELSGKSFPNPVFKCTGTSDEVVCKDIGEEAETDNQCCQGLEFREQIGYYFDDMHCEPHRFDLNAICIDCGDGTCNTEYENRCNCPEDCKEGCSNQCDTIGEKACGTEDYADYFRECNYYDNDDCLDLGEYEYCGQDKTCSDGECISACVCTEQDVCEEGDTGKICDGCRYKDAPEEECDGEDNDCDGQADESLRRSCSTLCGPGTEVCTNGDWINCNAPQPEEEICDNEDNNCDGNIDENGACCDKLNQDYRDAYTKLTNLMSSGQGGTPEAEQAYDDYKDKKALWEEECK